MPTKQRRDFEFSYDIAALFYFEYLAAKLSILLFEDFGVILMLLSIDTQFLKLVSQKSSPFISIGVDFGGLGGTEVGNICLAPSIFWQVIPTWQQEIRVSGLR